MQTSGTLGCPSAEGAADPHVEPVKRIQVMVNADLLSITGSN